MLIVGDKIELVKKMGVFDNIGEKCEIVGIDENCMISFRFGGYHMGCMSYDEFEKYFKKVEKREWIVRYDFPSDMSFLTTNIKIKENGRCVVVRSDKYDLSARATCHSEDMFDFKKGFEIAMLRLAKKIVDKELRELIS